MAPYRQILIVRHNVEGAYFLCVVWWRLYNDGETKFYDSDSEMCLL